MIWRLRRSPSRADYVWATATTALLLPVFAWLVKQSIPWVCATRAGAAVYLWGCLLPGLMLIVPPILAALLWLTHWANRKRLRMPDGVLPIILFGGTAAFLTMGILYAATLEPPYRPLFFWELLGLPQPFVAGSLTAAVFATVLVIRQAKQATLS